MVIETSIAQAPALATADLVGREKRRAPSPTEPALSPEPSSAGRTQDRVELSATGRQMAALLGINLSTPPGLSATHIRELADRLIAGYYSQTQPEHERDLK